MANQSKTLGGRSKKAATRTELLELVERQDYRCAASGEPIEPDTCALDHVVAVSKGGGHEIENLQILHKEVNRIKGTLSNDELLEWCKKIVRWNS